MLDLLNKVVEKNSPSIKQFRFKDKRGMATNQVNVVCLEELPFTSLDCFVDAEAFSTIFSGYKDNVTVVQEDEKTIVISSGDSQSVIGTEPMSKLLDIDKVPEGNDIEVGNFIEALQALKGFTTDTLYATEGFLYSTGNNDSTVIRTPITTGFSGTVFLTSDITTLLLMIKKAIISIKESPTKLAFLFESGWIETGKPNWALPADLSSFFKNFDSLPMEPLDAKFSSALKRICSFAKKDDVIDFDESGVQLVQGISRKHTINKPMPSRRMNPNHLAPVLTLDPSFDFVTDKHKIAFKTDKLSGFISGIMKQ